MPIKEEMAAAKSCGLTRFHSDTPCRKCGGEVRFACGNGACVKCTSYNSKSSYINRVIRGCA